MCTVKESITALSKHQIAQFFSKHAPATQEKCNQKAELLVRTPVHPALVQGATSYTVVADDDAQVVQFRDSANALDLDFLKYVEQSYKPFMKHHQYAGMVDMLYVYIMDNTDPTGLCQVLRLGVGQHTGLYATPKTRRAVFKLSIDLTELSKGLPASFRSTVDGLISRLPELFADDWPLVPHHTDLLENNIHVDPATGHICGICDWKDTVVGPFGTSLWSLETMLGVRVHADGWRYHANQQELRDLFWDSFRSALGPVSDEQMDRIEVAMLVGLFLENGFEYADAVNKAPIREGTYEMRYLEAVTLKLWARTEHS